MEFNWNYFSSNGHSYSEIERFSYKANPEIPNRVLDAIYEVWERTSRKPAKLLLGYGTYFTLCLTVTHSFDTFENKMGCVYRLTEFEGIPIVIDPSYEFRVDTIVSDDLWETSLRAAVAAARHRKQK